MMRSFFDALLVVVAVACLGCQGQASDGQVMGAEMKVFISVDMEGIAGVTTGSDVSNSGADYQYFRELATLEANAAVEGALAAAGAMEIVVRDGHGAKTFAFLTQKAVQGLQAQLVQVINAEEERAIEVAGLPLPALHALFPEF